VIGLLSCSAQKLAVAAPAARLYCSSLFQMSLRYLTRTCTTVYVLSARWDLVQLDDVIKPYDLQLSQLGQVERRRWGARIVKQLCELHRGSIEVLVFAGSSYVRPLRLFAPSWWTLLDPMQGMQVGQRLAWLSRANAALDEEPRCQSHAVASSRR
jgi:hypothetical protein